MKNHHYGPHRAPESAAPAHWSSYAECASEDPELMYPAPGGDGSAYQTAREMCMRCPVPEECLDDAMAYEGNAGKSSRYGVRAGLTPAQRADLYARGRRGRAAA